MEGTGKPSFPGERRRHRRSELSLALAYQWGMMKGILRTVDLSLGGVKVQADVPLPVDERLDLIILIENEAAKPVGRVVRSSPSSNHQFDVGIRFETISPSCRKRLERFLYRIGDEEGTRLGGKALDQSGSAGMEWKSFELDRVRGNFLRWLHRSHPGDYDRYAHRPEIGENEIRNFLKAKGIDKLNMYYLMKSFRGG